MSSHTTRRRGRPTAALQLLVSCVGALAMLIGLLPTLAIGPLGLLLAGGALLAFVLHIVTTARTGHSATRGLVEAMLVGAITFAVVSGSIWYFTVYLAAQPGLLRLGPVTPTPTP